MQVAVGMYLSNTITGKKQVVLMQETDFVTALGVYCT